MGESYRVLCRMRAAFRTADRQVFRLRLQSHSARLPGFPVTFCTDARPLRRRLRGGISPLFPVRLLYAAPEVLIKLSVLYHRPGQIAIPIGLFSEIELQIAKYPEKRLAMISLRVYIIFLENRFLTRYRDAGKIAHIESLRDAAVYLRVLPEAAGHFCIYGRDS